MSSLGFQLESPRLIWEHMFLSYDIFSLEMVKVVEELCNNNTSISCLQHFSAHLCSTVQHFSYILTCIKKVVDGKCTGHLPLYADFLGKIHLFFHYDSTIFSSRKKGCGIVISSLGKKVAERPKVLTFPSDEGTRECYSEGLEATFYQWGSNFLALYSINRWFWAHFARISNFPANIRIYKN